jgi:hypothetical protein
VALLLAARGGVCAVSKVAMADAVCESEDDLRSLMATRGELSNSYPSAAIWRKLLRHRPSISFAGAKMSEFLLKLPKPAAIAIQATLGIALSATWAFPALAAPASTETRSQTTPRLHEGDLVQLRSGGPALTVKSVQGNWVIAHLVE